MTDSGSCQFGKILAVDWHSVCHIRLISLTGAVPGTVRVRGGDGLCLFLGGLLSKLYAPTPFMIHGIQLVWHAGILTALGLILCRSCVDHSHREVMSATVWSSASTSMICKHISHMLSLSFSAFFTPPSFIFSSRMPSM